MGTAPTVPAAIVRDVCATGDEFARGLRAAMPGSVDAGPGRFEVANGTAVLAVVVDALPPRRLGVLALPRLRVVVHFVAGSDAACRALLAEMDRAMQRTGG